MENKINLNEKMDLFIGPCVIESEDFAFETAEMILDELKEFESSLNIFYKSSFDKANRSSSSSFRGPGIEKGIEIFKKIKEKHNVKIITDFHQPEQASILSSVVDCLQVPAFLCRQSDMIFAGAKACSENNIILKVKKGQFLSPFETKNIVEKAIEYLPKEKIYLTERGTSFGYSSLVVDMSSFSIMKSFGVKTIHDATHCVQMPGALGKSTGGKREFMLPIAQAALSAGADGVFMEAHPNPSKALSDSTTQIPIKNIKGIIKRLLAFKELTDKVSKEKINLNEV